MEIKEIDGNMEDLQNGLGLITARDMTLPVMVEVMGHSGLHVSKVQSIRVQDGFIIISGEN